MGAPVLAGGPRRGRNEPFPPVTRGGSGAGAPGADLRDTWLWWCLGTSPTPSLPAGLPKGLPEPQGARITAVGGLAALSLRAPRGRALGAGLRTSGPEGGGRTGSALAWGEVHFLPLQSRD